MHFPRIPQIEYSLIFAESLSSEKIGGLNLRDLQSTFILLDITLSFRSLNSIYQHIS